MRHRSVLPGVLSVALVIGFHVACTGEDPNLTQSVPDGGSSEEAGADGDGEAPLVPANKIDILFVVDNSASMGDKSSLLATSVGTLLRSVAHLGDMHVGVLASSLGSFGGDICPDTGDFNTFAHLRPSPNNASGILTYNGGDVEGLVRDTEDLVRSVGERGCGLEAQLESAYRFLVQPDPWQSIRVDTSTGQAHLVGVDDVVLAQRKAFLRPDSAVVVVLLTDEDDSSADPLAVDGQGWGFMARSFPGSKVFRGDPRNGTTAPRGTSACTEPGKGPAHPDCTSCGFAPTCDGNDPACTAIRNDVNCKTLGAQPPAGQTTDGYAGFYAPTEDALNVRFHRMKERFGVDPQYPIARYVSGFSNPRVPNREAEHPVTADPSGRPKVAEYVDAPSCTNPLFAGQLPGDATAELCNLPRGPRNRGLVVFAAVVGVPNSLVVNAPNWNAILGTNPAAYDTTGIDPHMIQSVVPRPGLASPSDVRGDNGSDPIHGREWDTKGNDLQFACTFTLATPRQCSPQDASCDCAIAENNPPVCGATLGEQLKAKAYPSIRPLRVARELGPRGVVGSICSTNGYEGAITTLALRIAPLLAQ